MKTLRRIPRLIAVLGMLAAGLIFAALEMPTGDAVANAAPEPITSSLATSVPGAGYMLSDRDGAGYLWSQGSESAARDT